MSSRASARATFPQGQRRLVGVLQRYSVAIWERAAARYSAPPRPPPAAACQRGEGRKTAAQHEPCNNRAHDDLRAMAPHLSAPVGCPHHLAAQLLERGAEFSAVLLD